MDITIAPEQLIRLSVFLCILAVMLAWQRLRPRRPLVAQTLRRWLSNFGIGALNVAVLRLAFPFLGAGLAVVGAQHGWGLLHHLALPVWLKFAVSILALDLVIYFQHRMFHAVPMFWRLHRMHHADLDFDTTTGVRFHPLEAIVSMLIKSIAIVALGVGPAAFVVFEIVLNGTSLFNHGNVAMRRTIDQWLRWIVVTPDMHRVHHSVLERELNRNFGFNLPWWDRLCRT
jgi:sterol desaturase/sphingolipid hydroxylase (fatty acid hydroxylase superfamily)